MSKVNTTDGFGGRLGNHIIRNVYASLLAEKGDLPFTYGYYTYMDKLGIPLFTTGKTTYDKTVVIKDEEADSFLDKSINFNIIIDGYVQTSHFSRFLYDYFRTPSIKASVQNANIFKERYGNNNDVFVHIRLDDATHWSPGFSYYVNAIEATGAKTGYVSSDSPDHILVKRISEAYGFPIIRTDKDTVDKVTTSIEAIDTIMLATTCKHLVLSHGTFSWTIGALTFDAVNVFIPPLRFINKSNTTNNWVGDIYHIDSWKVIEP